jgi:hypothetical protein
MEEEQARTRQEREPHLINEEELLAVHIHLKDDTGHLSGERLVFLPPNPTSFEL